MSKSNANRPNVDKRFSQIPHLLTRLLLRLPRHHNDMIVSIYTFYPDAFPKQKTLAEMVGVTRSTANKTVRQLIQIGLLKVYHRYNDKGGKISNHYVITHIESDEHAKAIYQNFVSLRNSVQRFSSDDTYPCVVQDNTYPCVVQDSTSHVSPKTTHLKYIKGRDKDLIQSLDNTTVRLNIDRIYESLGVVER